MKKLPLAVLLLVISTFAFAQNKPLAADQTTPRGALKAFTMAMHRGDDKTIHAVLHTPNPAELEVADAMIQTSKATVKLREAAEAKLGKGAATKLKVDINADDEAKFDAAIEEITEDKATVRLTEQDSNQIPLIKIQGSWKIALAEMFGNNPLAEVAKTMKGIAEATNATAQQIMDGKVTTVEDAQRALLAEVQAGRAKNAPTNKPD